MNGELNINIAMNINLIWIRMSFRLDYMDSVYQLLKYVVQSNIEYINALVSSKFIENFFSSLKILKILNIFYVNIQLVLLLQSPVQVVTTQMITTELNSLRWKMMSKLKSRLTSGENGGENHLVHFLFSRFFFSFYNFLFSNILNKLSS